MEVLLFNCRPLQMTSTNTEIKGTFSIFTVFYPDLLICFDAVFFMVENEKGESTTQCTFFEETPKKLDPELDDTTLDAFDEMMETNQFVEALLPDDIAKKVMANAMDVGEQLISN